MSVMLKELLAISPLNRGSIVAGNPGLNNIVESSDVLEVNMIDLPDAFNFVQANVLLISSMYSVKDNIDNQEKLLRMLHDRGVSGLVLCHLGLVLPELNPRLTELCNKLSFPLVIMPSDIGYSEIILSVSDVVLKRKNAKLRTIMTIYNSISRMLMRTKSSRAIVDEFTKLTGRDALYFNHNTVLVHATLDEPACINYTTAQIKLNSSLFFSTVPGKSIGCIGPDYTVYLYPVINNSTYFGVFGVLGKAPITDIEQIATAQTLNALCLSALSKITMSEQRRQMISELVMDIVKGHSEGTYLLHARAAELNCDLSHAWGVICVDMYGFLALAEQRDESELLQLKKRLAELTEIHLFSISKNSIFCSSSDKIIILFIEDCKPEAAQKRMEKAARSLFDFLMLRLEAPVTVGIGTLASSFSELCQSYESAMVTIDTANTLLGYPSCANSKDFIVYATLHRLASHDKDEVRKMVHRLLTPLEQHDKEKGTCLLETLEVLLRNNLDTSLTAKELFVHRNTVLQRKRKIIGIYDYDPFAPMQRIQFEIAFMLRGMLSNR